MHGTPGTEHLGLVQALRLYPTKPLQPTHTIMAVLVQNTLFLTPLHVLVLRARIVACGSSVH
jgi:hypothetical protein